MSRQHELAKIHIGKKELGLDDETYREMLGNLTGKTSSATLNAAERLRVIRHMAERGANIPTHSGRSHKQPEKDDWRSPRIRKIYQMWNLMAAAGVVQKSGLKRWIQNQYRVERLEWADAQQLNGAIEALKQWSARDGVTTVTDYRPPEAG